MASPARLTANRLNARRSTGPRTPAGRQAVAHNAVRHGLYATAALLPALGETAEDWAAFRAAVAAGLHPEGAAEYALAERVAYLLWRQRRVAAFAPGADAPLPPDPDAVTGRGVDPHAPLPADAPPAVRLARARAATAAARRGLAHARAGAAALGGADGPLDVLAAASVTAPVGALVGWATGTRPSPWVGLARELGDPADQYLRVRWTGDLLRRAVARAGGHVGRDPAEFLAEARVVVAAGVADAEGAVSRAEAEEAALLADLRAARAQAAAGAVVAADPRAERADRAEAHLSRELGRALGQLERLRMLRSAGR